MKKDRMQDASPFHSRFSLLIAAILFIAFFWITYLVIGLGSHVMDEWGIMISKEVRKPYLTIIMHAITQLGDVYILVIVVVLFVTGWWKKHRIECRVFFGDASFWVFRKRNSKKNDYARAAF